MGHCHGSLVVSHRQKGRLVAYMGVSHPKGSDWQFDRGKQAAL